MTIKEAMESYFKRLIDLYENMFGTFPTVSYDSEADPSMFFGEPDKDGEIQWKYSPAKPINVAGLCDELTEFYSSFYYWHLRGKLGGISYSFPHVINLKGALKTAETALTRGKKLFPEENMAVIGYCRSSMTDGLLLVYDQDSDRLFIYDGEFEKRYPCDDSLADILSLMEAVI